MKNPCEISYFYNREKKLINRLTSLSNSKILFCLADSDIYEILLFLHIFDYLRCNQNFNCRLVLGIKEEFQFIKNLYSDSSSIYFLKNLRDLSVYQKKFDYIFIIQKENILNFDFLKRCIGEFKVDPIQLNIDLKNEFSDIIGVHYDFFSNSNLDISLSTQNCINQEIINCGLTIQNFYINNYKDISMFKNNNIKHIPLESQILINDKGMRYKYFVSTIFKISECKFFIGIENYVTLLAYMILGKNRCIILNNSCELKNKFSFLENFINIKPFNQGAITEILCELYSNLC